jgi:pilus assembly protein CpaE
LETLKQGADEFLDWQNVEPELAGALERFRSQYVRREVGPKSGRVIALVSPSGGSGSSTLAASISTVLAQEHGDCGLVDLRLGVGDLAPMLDLRPARTLADMCDHIPRLDQSLFEQFLVRHASGVWLLAAPSLAADVGRVTGKGVRRALALARVRFSHVVVDMDNVLGGEQMEALWQADWILLILRLDYTSVRNTRRMIDAMTDLGVSRERMKVVANGRGQRRQLDVAQAEAAVGMKVHHQVPYDAAAVNSAINNGVPLVLHRRFRSITRSIKTLAHSVNGIER